MCVVGGGGGVEGMWLRVKKELIVKFKWWERDQSLEYFMGDIED